LQGAGGDPGRGAVANSRIAKYDKANRAKVAEWSGERSRYRHINSCEGQAIAFDKSPPGVLFGISRPNREVVSMKLPPVAGR